MGIHGGEWRVHASAIDDVALITESIKWLSGEGDNVSQKREKSAHGAQMHSIVAKMNSKRGKDSLSRVSKDSLFHILDSDIKKLIDDDKVLHIRIDLGRLVGGDAVIVEDSKNPVAKGRFKLEVYPGQDVSSVATKLIEEILR